MKRTLQKFIHRQCKSYFGTTEPFSLFFIRFGISAWWLSSCSLLRRQPGLNYAGYFKSRICGLSRVYALYFETCMFTNRGKCPVKHIQCRKAQYTFPTSDCVYWIKMFIMLRKNVYMDRFLILFRIIVKDMKKSLRCFRHFCCYYGPRRTGTGVKLENPSFKVRFAYYYCGDRYLTIAYELYINDNFCYFWWCNQTRKHLRLHLHPIDGYRVSIIAVII